MGGLTRTMGRGDKVRVDGYRREVDGESSFVVQDFKVLNRSKQNGQRQRRQQQQSARNSSSQKNKSSENNG